MWPWSRPHHRQLHELSKENVQNLQKELAIQEAEQAKFEHEIMEKLSIEKDTISQIQTLEVEKDKILAKLSEIKVSEE